MKNHSNLRKKLEMKKKPKYAMRKLSVGFVSCMLGFAILFGDVATASANGVESLLLASSGIADVQIDAKFTPPTQVDKGIPVVYFVKNTEKGIEKGKVKANTRVEVSELKEDKAPSKKVLRVHQGGFWDNGKNSESAYELTQKVYSNTNYKLEFSYFDARNGTIGIKDVSEVNGSAFTTGKSEGYELGKTSSYIPKTYNILTKNDKKVYQGKEASEDAIFYAYFNKRKHNKGTDLDISIVYARLVPATPSLKIKQGIIQVPLGSNENKQASVILKEIETTILKPLLNSGKPGEGIVVDVNNNENPVPATLGTVVKDIQITKAGDSFEVGLTAEKWGQELKDGKIQVVFYDEESYDKAAHEPKDIVAEPETKLVEGTGKSGDIIVVKDKNQTEIGRGIVSSDGKFSVAVNRELKEQEVLELKAVTGKSESGTVEATVKPVIRELKEPTDVVEVEDPANLTEEEQKQIKGAVLKANPDLGLTQDNIKVDPNSGKVTVDTEKVKAELEPEKVLVKKDIPVAPDKEETKVNVPSSKVVVGNPDRLTDLEKDLIKEAVKKTNPIIDLNSIKVDDRGNVFIEENGLARLVLTPSQTIIDGRDNYRPVPQERDRNDYQAGSIDFRFVKAPAEKRGEKAQVVAPKAEQKVEGRYKAYIFGYKDGSVRPNGKITRAEVAAMVARLMGYSLTDMSQPAFADTQSAWYNQYINAVVKAGVMAGYPDGTFKPNEYITRAEFAQILKNLDKANAAVSPFGDVKGHWAEKAIDQAFANQRIKGYEDGTFKPEKSITRVEVVTILNRMQNRTLGKENLPSDVSKFSDLDENAWYYLDMVSATNSYEYAKSKEKADGTHQMVKVIAEK